MSRDEQSGLVGKVTRCAPRAPPARGRILTIRQPAISSESFDLNGQPSPRRHQLRPRRSCRRGPRRDIGEIVDVENTFLLCYVRGPEGLIVELAERLDGAPG